MRITTNLYEIADKNDFKVIAESNLLSKKWFKTLNQKKGTYISFIGKLAKDPETLVAGSSDEEKASFYADLPKMLTPLVLEETLIKNSDRIIYDLIHKMKIDQTQHEDAYAVGLVAFRNSIWYYTKPDVLFTTYAYIAIKSKLKEFKRVLRMRDRDNASVCSFSSLNFESYGPDMEGATLEGLDQRFKKENKQYKMLQGMEKNVSFEYLINNSCYDDIDRKIIQCYLQNRNKWVDIFVESNLNPRTGKEYSRWAIHKRFNKIIERLRDIVESENIQQYQIVLKPM